MCMAILICIFHCSFGASTSEARGCVAPKPSLLLTQSPAALLRLLVAARGCVYLHAQGMLVVTMQLLGPSWPSTQLGLSAEHLGRPFDCVTVSVTKLVQTSHAMIKQGQRELASCEFAP